MVIPERVALEKIHLLPPASRGDRGGGGPRRRRALQRAAEALLLLRLPAAGTELYVQLRRDLRFLARDFVVEHRRGEGRRAPGPRRPSEERLCFYTGHVLNRSDSFASLSTCAGLVLAPRHDGSPASPQAPGAVASFTAVPSRGGFLSAPGFVLREMPHGGKKRLWGRASASAPHLSTSPQCLPSAFHLSTSPQRLASAPHLSAFPQCLSLAPCLSASPQHFPSVFPLSPCPALSPESPHEGFLSAPGSPLWELPPYPNV